MQLPGSCATRALRPTASPAGEPCAWHSCAAAQPCSSQAVQSHCRVSNAWTQTQESRASTAAVASLDLTLCIGLCAETYHTLWLFCS